jgi:hypothetical protein
MSNDCNDGNSSPLGKGHSSMSDFQFRASLDALLEFDYPDTGNTDGSSTDPLMQVNNTLSNKKNEEAMNAFLQQQEQALSGETPIPTAGIGDTPEFPVLQPITEAPQHFRQSSQFPVPQHVFAQHQQLPQQVQSSMHPYMFAMSALPSEPHVSLAMQQPQQRQPQQPQQQQQQQHQQNSSQQMSMYFGQQQRDKMIALSLQQMATSLQPAAAAAAAAVAAAAAPPAPAPAATPAVSNAPSTRLSMNPFSPAPPSHLSNSIRSYNNRRVRHGVASAVSEDERIRHDRNSREQQRSQQITTQIEELRRLLQSANVDVEKADKYSTLVTVGEYIKQLHDDAAELEAEHGRLVDTITFFAVPATTRKLENTLPYQGGPSLEGP